MKLNLILIINHFIATVWFSNNFIVKKICYFSINTSCKYVGMNIV